MTLLFCGFGFMLIWNKFSGAANKGLDKAKTVFEIGQNSGGVFQQETTEEINQYEGEVKLWHYNPQGFPKGRSIAFYKAIATKIYVHVKNNFGYASNIDEDYLLNLCKPLTANELRAVAVSFGVKDINNAAGMTSWTGHIFHLFDSILTDTFAGGNDMTAMKTIWAKTGLWI